MANVKISNLPAPFALPVAAVINGTETLPMDQTVGGVVTTVSSLFSRLLGPISINSYTNGGVTIATPTSGFALTISGSASGANTAQFQATTSSGNSFGLDIRAGTTAADRAIIIRNAAATSTLLLIDGTGATTIGPPTSSGTTALTIKAVTAAAGAVLQLDNSSATDVLQTNWALNGTNKAFVAVAGAANNVITGSAQGDFLIRTQGGNILFSQDSGTTGIKLYQAGTFTGTITGCTTSPTGTCKYVVMGNIVTLLLSTITGTSNTTSLTMTGLPAAIQPATAQNIICTVEDNTANIVGMAQVNAGSGTVTFFRDVLATGALSTTGFTAAGTKGFSSPTITYLLT